MNASQLEGVHQAVAAYLRGPTGRGFDLGAPVDFAKFVTDVSVHIGNVTADTLHMVSAMCVLGPGSASEMAPAFPSPQKARDAAAIIDELEERLRSLIDEISAAPMVSPGRSPHLRSEVEIIHTLTAKLASCGEESQKQDRGREDHAELELVTLVTAMAWAVHATDAVWLRALLDEALTVLERRATRLDVRAFRGAMSPPPVTVCEELLAILRQNVPDQTQRLARTMEFVIAYGVGKWRQVQDGLEAWDTRWQGAQRALARAMIGAVRDTDRWMRAHIVGFPIKNESQLWHDATRLVWRIIRPESVQHVLPGQTILISGDASLLSGAKAVWSLARGKATLTLPDGSCVILSQGTKLICGDFDPHIRIQVITPDRQNVPYWQFPHNATAWITVSEVLELTVWECGCGHKLCAARHRLAAWDPTTVVHRTTTTTTKDGKRKKVQEATPLTLWDFVASAVKGPDLSIKTGSFQQGMYFPLLTEEVE